MSVHALAAGFDPADRAQWEALARKALNGGDLDRLTGKTDDRLAIGPLYEPSDRAPLALRPPGAWTVLQAQTHPDPKEANRRLLADLEGGVAAIRLVCDPTLSRAGGILVAGLADLRTLLDGVLLDVAPVHLSAGWTGTDHALLLAALVAERGLDPAAVTGTLGLDPVTFQIAGGSGGADRAVAAVRWATEALPRMQALEIDAAAYHGAGATEAQELAVGLGLALSYLRVLDAAGLPPAQAAQSLAFRYAADADLYVTVAKLRVARLLWARLGELLEADLGPARIAAESAARMITRFDPSSNIIRNTLACTGAAIGGADAITITPHDAAAGVPSAFAHRVARNLQSVLMAESHLGQVSDPAAGAGAFDTLTDDLAAAAWERFTVLEAAGGLSAPDAQQTVRRWLAEARTARAKAIARRRPAITGVSAYPDLDEKPVQTADPDWQALLSDRRAAAPAPADAATLPERLAQLQQGRSVAAIDGAEGLAVHRLAAPFEALRDAAPATPVFLATLGPLADHTVRASWVRAAVAAGGLRTADGPGGADLDAIAQAFAASGATSAIIAGSDAAYDAHLAPLAQALKAQGARVWKAGRPADTDPDGLSCVFEGCDLIAALQALQDEAA